MNANAGNNVEILINSDEDVILARQKVRQLAQELGFSMLDQTRFVTAVSELARNIVVHAKGGKVLVNILEDRPGLRVVFEDHGPGIPDIEKVTGEGYNSTTGMGLGLKGSKRLVDEFDIQSTPGKGTTVVIKKWK